MKGKKEVKNFFKFFTSWIFLLPLEGVWLFADIRISKKVKGIYSWEKYPFFKGLRELKGSRGRIGWLPKYRSWLVTIKS